MCGHQAATTADHILSARLILDNFGLDAFYDSARLQGLCHDCHSIKTAILEPAAAGAELA
jgi:5-methylcytosine-specific restriction endonuclease McrA